MFFEKSIDQRNGSGTVNIVIAVNQNVFFVFKSMVNALYGFVHVLHQEGIMQVFE